LIFNDLEGQYSNRTYVNLKSNALNTRGDMVVSSSVSKGVQGDQMV